MTTYKELAYLESTGVGSYTSGQYIDTGLNYFADFEVTAMQQESAGMKTLGTTTYYCLERENADTNAWRFRNGQNVFFTTNVLITDLHTMGWKNGKVYADGTELGSFEKTAGTNRMYLFAAKNPNGNQINRYPIRIYACKLWNPSNGELVRDFIPVLDFNNTPAMYDKVNDVLYYNQGSGDFLYQRKGYFCEVEYLESTGTQYIDTEYIPTANTSFELSGVDMDYTAGMIRFGSRVDTIKENYCFTTIASSDFRFTYGSGPTTTSIQYIYSTHKLAKKVSFDATTKICTITFNDDTTEYSSAFNTTPLTSAAQSIYLFAFNNSGTAVYGTSKQSGLKIYEDGVLARDYIPVLDWDMVPCFYDKITGEKLYNQGTGQFLYGAKETKPSIQLRRKFNMLLASHKNPEYTPLKYIESSGTQYIVTPVTFSGDNYRIECGYDNTDTPEATTPFGYQDTGSGVQIMVIGFNNANSTGTLFWNGTGTAHTNRARLNAFTKGLNRLDIKANNGTITYSVNGDTPISYSATTSFSPQTGNMWLFGNNRQSIGGSHQLVTMKFYYLRIYKDGDIVYNFVPVLDKDGVPCILDTVSKKFYYNSGTGTFAYEEWYLTPCDYVYTDGDAYVNTQYYGDENTATEVYVKSEDLAYRIAIGSRKSAQTNNITTFVCDTVGGVVQDFGDYRATRQTTSAIALGNYVRCYNSKSERWTLEDGGTKITTTTSFTGTLATPTPLYIGYRGAGSYPGTCANFKGNYKEVKIYQNGVLVRNFIPAIDENNKAGLYDKDLNTMFYSVGNSDYVGHFVENSVDYKVVKNIIASQVATATNTLACPFIKTGVVPAYSKNTRMVAKFAYAHTDTTYEYFCGVNYGSRFVFGHASTNNRVYFGLGAQNYTSSYVMDTNVHLYKLDWATAKAGIDDNEYTLSSAGQSDSTSDFWINARHTSTNANANRPMGGTSYWWKFWEGKKLVYNGIPVVRVSDNKVGLFETVNRAFQTTAGTVEYTYTA